MARICCLLPDRGLVALSSQLASEHGFDIFDIRQVSLDNAVDAAKVLIAESQVDIIIARGSQAELIHRNVPVPVVNIQMSAMELLQLVHKCAELQPEHLHIALISSTSSQLFLANIQQLMEQQHIQISLYNAVTPEDHPACIERAIADGANVFVGGAVTRAIASQLELKYVPVETGAESLLTAYEIAAEIANAIDIERKNNEEMRVCLDYSTNGTVKINRSGNIQFCNGYVERLLAKSENEIVGKLITDFFPELNDTLLAQTFENNKESYTYVRVGKETMAANILPITLENQPTQSALIFLHDSTRIRMVQENLMLKRSSLPGRAVFTFDGMPNVSRQFKQVREQIMMLSKFSALYHLSGSFGTEKTYIAEAIHNSQRPHSTPFTDVYCTAAGSYDFTYRRQSNTERLHKLSDVLENWQYGTLMLAGLSNLSFEDQHVLYELIARRYTGSSKGDTPLLITADKTPLPDLLQQGKLLPELFYALCSVDIILPPMHERVDDVEAYIEYYLNSEMEHFGRYVKLTQDAHEVIRQHKWVGGLHEIRAFVRSVIFMSPKRSVDAMLVMQILGAHTPPKSVEHTAPRTARSAPAERIIQALHDSGGKQAEAARKLGISTTTLWRSIKKYGLSKDDWM